MVIDPIPSTIKRAWSDWNLQFYMLLSLSLQTFLILFAPLRPRTANVWLISLIWSAYLLADAAALYAIGQISRSTEAAAETTINSDLLVFWAPFLLLHLGGPDTITAFSLEDNALWLRHLFNLITQVVPVVYVFVQSIPSNKLLTTTIPMLLAGTIKYAERTRALYLASFDTFQKSMTGEADPGKDYVAFMEDFAARQQDAKAPRFMVFPDPPLYLPTSEEGGVDNISAVKHAHRFFEVFKGALVDRVFSASERAESQEFFYRKNSEVAMRVISIELNFMYQVLYTKVVVVRSKLGYISRFISFSAIVIALLLFNSSEKHMSLHPVDAGITYSLLYGAISLEAIAFLMLFFSDWTAVALLSGKGKFSSTMACVLDKYLNLRRPNLSSTEEMNSSNLLDWTRRILFQRWSESVSCYNLIHYCLKESPKLNPNMLDYCGIIYDKVINVLGLEDFQDQLKYVSSKPLSGNLWDFVFKRLKYPDGNENRHIPIAGNFGGRKNSGDWKNHCNRAVDYARDVDGYDQTLLLWHIATEICYNTDDDHDHDDHEANITTDQKKRREFSKVMSDYMLYLLVMQPTLMSPIAGIARKRVQDTCAEAKRFFSQNDLGPGSTQEQACRTILQVDTGFSPVMVRGDSCKSVLFDACILAKQLKEELKENKWDLINHVACICWRSLWTKESCTTTK